jgi:tripartite-type tricarboxylate transporter receptor subunit TctC
MPAPVVERIHADVVRALGEPAVRQKLLEQALDPVGNTPAQFAAQIRDEYQRYGKALALAGVKPE